MKKLTIIIGIVILCSIIALAIGEVLEQYEKIGKDYNAYPQVWLCLLDNGIIEDTTCVMVKDNKDKKKCYIDENENLYLKCENGWKKEIITNITKPKIN